MAERFQKLFSLKDNLYIENAPIIISAGALLKDTKSGNIVVQIKLKSVSENNIKGVKISLLAFDVSGKEINGVEEYQYLDLNISNGQNFGSNKAIVMPETTTRSFAIKSITVIFTDSSVWEIASPEFVIIPESKTLNSEFQNEELVKQYKISTTNKATYIPNTFLNLWTCCCGEANCKSCCTNCGKDKNTVFSKYNIKDLTEDMNLRLAKEKEERLAKERNIEIEKIKQKKKKTRNIKLATIATLMLSLCIAIIYVLNFVVIPNNKYNNAINFYNNNEFDKAIAILLEIDDFKDSKEYLTKCYTKKFGVEVTLALSSSNTPYLKIDKGSISKNGEIPNSIEIPSVFNGELVTVIEQGAFYKCSNITVVKIHNNISKIGASAFNGCSNLREINLPNTITEIDSYAFNGCFRLENITFGGTKAEWNKIWIRTWNESNKPIENCTVHCIDGDISGKNISY